MIDIGLLHICNIAHSVYVFFIVIYREPVSMDRINDKEIGILLAKWDDLEFIPDSKTIQNFVLMMILIFVLVVIR